MKPIFLLFASWLVLILGATSSAQAAPQFQIVGVGGVAPTNAESIGDAGGTSYPSVVNAGAVPGAGMPTINGGWPTAASFGIDDTNPWGCTPGVDCYVGISGYDASYLRLTEPGRVTFQFMGKGDATDHNLFQVYLNGAWTTVWDNQSASNGTCGASGNPPAIICSTVGSSVGFNFPAGYIPFRFVNLTTPGTATNDGTGGNISPDKPPYPSTGGFFLGVDPYQATGQYDTTGQAVYAGFTDRGFTAPGVGDHDYEDLIVRMSVSGAPSIPTLSEWGMIILSSLLALGTILSLRRQRQ